MPVTLTTALELLLSVELSGAPALEGGMADVG